QEGQELARSVSAHAGEIGADSAARLGALRRVAVAAVLREELAPVRGVARPLAGALDEREQIREELLLVGVLAAAELREHRARARGRRRVGVVAQAVQRLGPELRHLDVAGRE